MIRVLAAIAALSILAAPASAERGAPADKDYAKQHRNQQIVVNNRALSQHEINTLVSLYGQVYVGRYWYDPISGLYGYEGQGAAGQLAPGLAIGGQLSPSASGGGYGRLTGVFINGREIHPDEYMVLYQIYGQVMPGRYWMNAQGVAGPEGGPPMLNIAADAQRMIERSTGGPGSVYLPWLGAQPGTHVGRASDGCLYVSQGGFSADYCD